MNQAALINLALLALFGLQHSIMARAWFKQRVKLPKPRRTYALAPTAALSDALSTAFMVMDPAEISALCERLGQVEALELSEE